MTEADKKRFATLQAIAAISVIQLLKTDDDHGRPSFYATKWAMTRHFGSLDDVAEWLATVTGKKVEA